MFDDKSLLKFATYWVCDNRGCAGCLPFAIAVREQETTVQLVRGFRKGQVLSERLSEARFSDTS